MLEALNFQHFNLTGKTFLVTGGATGIGRAIAHAAEKCGARVAIVDLVKPLANELESAGGAQRLAITANVCDELQCRLAVEQVVEHLGVPDVLVNSAGIIQRIEGTTRQTLQHWREVIDVNLQGTFLMARETTRVMAPRGCGSIVNIGSVAGLVGFRASNAYGVAKAGVAMLTKTLALDFARKGIRVNAVAPGFIDTNMAQTLESHVPSVRELIYRRTPLGRYGSPQEVASVVLFLASDLSSFVTGAVIPVDGGWTSFGGFGDAS